VLGRRNRSRSQEVFGNLVEFKCLAMRRRLGFCKPRNRRSGGLDEPGALRDESGHPQRRRCHRKLIIEARQWQATPQS
jgi:hypothetical protein